MRDTSKKKMINKFTDKYQFLSNFYPCKIEYQGKLYHSVEAAYQAQKCPEEADRFVNISAKEAKKLGKKVKLRQNWNKIKVGVMYDLLKLKFTDPDLKQQLLETKNKELVEDNWWHDTYWGVCNGVGQNILGKLLMRIRDEL